MHKRRGRAVLLEARILELSGHGWSRIEVAKHLALSTESVSRILKMHGMLDPVRQAGGKRGYYRGKK